MDRDGSCVQGCCKFPLAPTTCAFLAMDRRMDRNGSGWIVGSGLQVDARAAHPERREGPDLRPGHKNDAPNHAAE